ncbi:hypothetical protein [Variovorax paradoxus]
MTIAACSRSPRIVITVIEEEESAYRWRRFELKSEGCHVLYEQSRP